MQSCKLGQAGLELNFEKSFGPNSAPKCRVINKRSSVSYS